MGTTSGHVVVYDIRRPAPLLIKDHQYGTCYSLLTTYCSLPTSLGPSVRYELGALLSSSEVVVAAKWSSYSNQCVGQ